MFRKTLTVMTSLLLSGTSAFAQDANWMVSEVSGTVVVGTGAAAVPARKGGQVPPGAVVSTGGRSRAVLVHGKDFVTVNANGRVRIPAPGDQGYGLFDVLQEWGNALFQIEKQPKPHFTVRTRYLAAVVKGTTFSITVSDQGASLQVVEGAVETSTVDGGARELITPGVVAMVEAADRMRLTVQDQQTRTIDSPARTEAPARNDNKSGGDASAAREPAATVSNAEPGSRVVAEPMAEMSTAPMESFASGNASRSETQELTEAITASPTNLGAATDGFVSGTVVAQLASADIKVARSELGSDGRGSDNGDAGRGNSSAGSGNSGQSGSGSDKGNSGGNETSDRNGSSAGNGNSGPSSGGGSENGEKTSQDSSGSSGDKPGQGSGSDNSNGAGKDNSGSNGSSNGTSDRNGSGSGNGNSGQSGGGSDDSNKSGPDSNGSNDSKPGQGSGSDNSNGAGKGNPGNGNGNSGDNGAGSRVSAGLGIGANLGGPKLGLDLSVDTARPGGRGNGGRGD